MASTSSEPEVEITNPFEGIAPPARSTISGKKLPYDVFINYRGSDVKHSLAMFIYNALSSEGVRVFLDSDEMELGASFALKIQQAILSVSLHIAIFSPNYAQSDWCLSKLSLMLETGTRIVPIFCHVHPLDLRWAGKRKGIYADAFSRHVEEAKFTGKEIESLMMALDRISFTSGLVISNQEDQEMALKDIVNITLSVMKKEPIEEGTFAVGPDETLKTKVPLNKAEYTVGLDEILADFEKHAFQSPQSHRNILIVGIVGMGGCGKTTLAKELYNRKAPSFNGSSFISEVRNVSKNDLPNLQKKLLDGLLGDKEGFTSDNRDQRSRRVFIVLDDIDYEYQLEALMAIRDRLGPGSIIIITTRDNGILDRFDKSIIIYEMKPMDRPHAEHLFSWHAFNRISPEPGFEDLVGKFIDACEGLPLTLKVIGGLLRGQKKDFWESQSETISRLVPKDVRERLKLSYDALDKERKTIFLDIACFYDGKDKDLALSVWKQSGWDGERSLDILVDKSLVQLDDFRCLKMHIHLRDLGRQIAYKELPSRLHLDEQNKSIEKPVEDYPNDEFDTAFQIWIMDNEQNPVALKTTGDYIMREKSNKIRLLKWLVWHDCPQSSILSGISLENLRILHLRNGFFNKLWLHDVKLPQLLEELNILCSIAEFPKSIRHLEHLKKIVVDGWPNTSLKALPEEFCQLKSLEHLTLRWCITLTSLPRHLGDLTTLRRLDLAFCDRLMELPHSFEQLVNLSYIDFQGCESLVISPHFFGEIRGLEHLNLMDCRNLKVLPGEVPFQEFLRNLNLVGTRLERLPNEVGRLVNLVDLKIGSSSLTDLPISLGNMTNLRTLSLEDCQSITCLPDSLWQMTNLKTLNLENCQEITCLLDSLGQMTNLRTLSLKDCQNLTYLPNSLGQMTNLQTLNLENCQNLTCLPDSLGHMTNLRTLSLENCQNLTCLPDSLEQIKNLRTLNMKDCKTLTRLPESLRLRKVLRINAS